MQRNRFTFEFLIYSLILVLAIFLRFQVLGHNPLSTGESEFALQSLGIARGEHPTISAEPGYVILTSILFSIFQPSDFFARFWPALFGSLLVLIPLLYRSQIGKITTLLFSLFLALDPILVAQSRSADGSMFALLGLTTAIGFILLCKPIPAGVFLGIALLGGENLWMGLITLALFGLFLIRPIFRILKSDGQPGWTQKDLTLTVLSFIATVIVLASIFMLVPRGISALGSGLVGFIQSWSVGNQIPVPALMIAWALTYLPVLGLAIWSIFIGQPETRKTRLVILAVFFVLWLAAILNPGIGIQSLPWATLPLWCLVAMFVHDFVSSLGGVKRRFVWLGMTILFIVVFIFSFTNFNNLVYTEVPTREIIQGRLLGVALPFLLLFLVSILVSWSWSRVDTIKGILTGIVIVLLVTIPGATLRSAGFGNQQTNELWDGISYTLGEKNLTGSLETFGKWSTGLASGANILVRQIDDPSLTWALRNFDKVTFSPVDDPETQPSIVLTSPGEEVQSVSVYRGQEVAWLSSPDYTNFGFRDWMKWRLYRQAPVVVQNYRLWVRNDLFPGGSSDFTNIGD